MSSKYKNLLSPIKVGNAVFKNRLTTSPSRAKFVQGSEPYPTEAMITHYANKARNGAALVTCGTLEAPFKIEAQKLYGHNSYVRHRVVPEGGTGTGFFDGLMEHADNLESYLSQMTEAVHFYGAKASMWINVDVPPQYDVSAGAPPFLPAHEDRSSTEEIPADLLDKIADNYALKAAFTKDLGFDMVFLHMSYRASLLARFLSPITNKRTDDYGGSMENRARFPIMVADRIKQKCGTDFLIEANISGCEPLPGGPRRGGPHPGEPPKNST